MGRDLAKAWGMAILVWFAGELILGIIVGIFGTYGQFASNAGSALWVIIPELIVFGGMVVLAALVHRNEQRGGPGRHAVAVLAVPAFALVLTLLYSLATDIRGTAIVERVITEVVITVAAWLVMRRLAGVAQARTGYL